MESERGYWIETSHGSGRSLRVGIWRDCLTYDEALAEFHRLRAKGMYARVIHRGADGVPVGVDTTRRPAHGQE